MFEDDPIPDFYREVNKNITCYEPLERYLHNNPGLILSEAGPGTGARANFILNALDAADEDGDGSTL